MEDFDKYLDQLVENFFDTGKIEIVEDIETNVEDLDFDVVSEIDIPEKNRRREQKTTKGKEREELKNSIDKHKGDRTLVMKDFGAVSNSWFIRNVNRHGLRDYYDSKKEGWELEKFKEELKNIIDKYKGNRQEILKYYGKDDRTLMSWLDKTNLRDYFRCFEGNEKMPSNFTKEDIKNAIDEYEGNLQKMMSELCLSKRRLFEYFKYYDLTGYYNEYNYDNKYENSFLKLGFKKPKDKGLESRIHNLRSKGYSFVDNIKNEEVTPKEISDFILSNIIEYMTTADDIVKYDLLSANDIKDFNGNVIIPKESKIESKDINQTDSYYSEFLASPVKKSEYGILDDESYLNKYNEVIGVIYEELNKKGNKITDKIKQLLTNDLEGMILSNNIYVPNKDNNIEFYLSNIGHSSPEKQLRITVRYSINLNKRKNFYRIGDGIWEITEGKKSEKGVLYPLSDKPLLTYGERKIYSEDDNMIDRIVENFFDTGKVVLNEQETEEKCLKFRCDDMGLGNDHSHVFLNGCVKRLCDTDINTDKGLIFFNKIIFNISPIIRDGEVSIPITFELEPSSFNVHNEKTYYIYKDYFEMKPIEGTENRKPYFTVEKLKELIGEEKFDEYFEDDNYVEFKGLWGKIKNYNHNHDPTIGTKEGAKRSKILRTYSNILALSKHLSQDQLKNAYKLLKELYGLGYPPVEKDNITVDPSVSLYDVQSDKRWGRKGEWFIKNQEVIDNTLKEVYEDTNNWLSKEQAEIHNVAQGVINVGDPAVGGEDYGWSILNFFNTNSIIREKLVEKYFSTTTPNEFNIDDYIKWVNENGTALFSNLGNNGLLKEMIKSNLETWEWGQGHEVNTVNRLKEILDEGKWEIIFNSKPGTLKDMWDGVDIEIKNKTTENVYGIQVKPLKKKLNGNVVHTKGAKSYNTNKVHFWVFMGHKTDYEIFVNDGNEEITSNLKSTSGGKSYDKIEFKKSAMRDKEFIEKLDTPQQNESTDRIDNIIENFFDTGNFDI